MSDLRPFLSTIAAATPAPRAFGSTLPAIATEAPTSPWSPQVPAAHPPPAAPAPVIDTAAIEAEARERARAEGLAETATLREQLQAAITAFTTARAALVTPSALKIAAAAAAVIGAWSETAPPAELYAPMVHAWITRHDAPAIAHVAPAHVAALQEMIGGAPITVVADAAMHEGDIRFSSSTMELAHDWDQRMTDLRDAIAAALEPA